MHTEYYKEYSRFLNRDMEFKVYGYAGKPASKPFDSLSAARRQTKEKGKIHQEFENGDIVRHPKFGEGMVIEQDDKTMTVMFDDYGQKKLGKGYVKMEKVN